MAAALLLFGFFGLPPIVKAQAVKRLSERLGREVTIEKVRINPLVLSATIEGLAIAEADAAKGEFVGWRRLYVNYDSWSLLAGEIGFQEIALDGFSGRVAKAEDGTLNFADILERLASADAPGSEDEDAGKKDGPTPVAIGRLWVTDAQVGFSDASLERPYSAQAGPLTFTLEKFRTVGDPNSPYQFEAVTEAGERLAWKGTVSADPVRSQGELVLGNIDLARLSPYYHRMIAGEVRSAFLDVSGKYAFELRGAEPALTLADASVVLRDLRLGAPGNEADALVLRRLAVEGVTADSIAAKAAVEKVSLQGLQVKAVRDAEGIDLLRLVGAPAGAATPKAPPAAAASAGGTKAPTVNVKELSVSGVALELVDLTTSRRAEHRIEDLAINLLDLDSADLAKAMPLTLELKLPQDGRVTLGGTVAAQPAAADLDIAVEGVGFANASPYVEPFLNVRLAGGVLRAKGKATLRDGALAYAGDFGVAAFHAVDGKLAQDFARWTDFSVKGIRAGTRPLAFHADEIRLVEPAGAVRVEADGSLSIDHVAAAQAAGRQAKPGAVAGSATEAKSPLPKASVGRVVVERGAFRFEDRSVQPAARGEISDFGGFIAGLDSEAPGRGELELRGKVDGVAPVAITGKINPLARPAFVDLRVELSGMDLQPAGGPYIGKFAGRELARGNLNVAIKARLEDRRLDTDNVVTLDRFYLGAKTDSPEATKLPVGLALALLRDTEGRIVVDLPVKGDLDDPSFKIGRVVVRVIVNILTKAATSPFSLIGAAFGGGGEELGWQEFAPGAAALDEAGIKKLETVAKALNGRPALNLDIAGSHDPARDLEALRRTRLDQEVRALAWETRRQVDPNAPPPEELDISPVLRAGMLAKLYASVFPPAPGEPAPLVVTGEGPGALTIPLVPTPGPEAAPTPAKPEERPRRQLGRLPKFGTDSAPEAAPSVGFPPVAPERPAGEEGAAAGPTITVPQMEARLLERVAVPEAELQALAEARAQAIRAWLLGPGKVAGERVFLAPATKSGTRVNLILK